MNFVLGLDLAKPPQFASVFIPFHSSRLQVYKGDMTVLAFRKVERARCCLVDLVSQQMMKRAVGWGKMPHAGRPRTYASHRMYAR
jgi:hypothetical protein